MLACTNAAEAWSVARNEQLEDVEAKRRLEDAEREWNELRDRVLELGGVRPNADYCARNIPKQVIRRHAADRTLDVIADTLGFDGDAELANALNRAWDNAKRARQTGGAA
jgi:hypothetical protein